MPPLSCPQSPSRLRRSGPGAAAFWQSLLGGRIVSYPDMGVEALRAPGITLDFVTVPEAKATKNRWHLDLATDAPEALTQRVLALGGSDRGGLPGAEEGFVVMRDPEGNEFCILRNAPRARRVVSTAGGCAVGLTAG